MVTDYQLSRAIMSLAYRRRLGEGIDELEETIYQYLNDHQSDTTSIAGYRVYRNNGILTLEQIPVLDPDQLELPLDPTDEVHPGRSQILLKK